MTHPRVTAGLESGLREYSLSKSIVASCSKGLLLPSALAMQKILSQLILGQLVGIAQLLVRVECSAMVGMPGFPP